MNQKKADSRSLRRYHPDQVQRVYLIRQSYFALRYAYRHFSPFPSAEDWGEVK